MRKFFNKFEKILKTLRKILLKFKRLFRKIEKILLILKFFLENINMKYYFVLKTIVNFENFLLTLLTDFQGKFGSFGNF